MFWSPFILARSGPLGTVWIAAHSTCATKLRKSQIAETDLAESCGACCSQLLATARALLLGVGVC